MARSKSTGTQRSAKDIKRTVNQIHEATAKMSEILIKEENESDAHFAQRQEKLRFEQKSKLKEVLMQNVSKTTSNRTFTQYTKSLVKTYLQNPYSYRDQLRELSRYLWRVSSLYKKLIMYYATMPTFNYYVTPKLDLYKEINADKELKNYVGILKSLQLVNFQHEFSQAIALALRDGLYCSFVYDNGDDGIFFHVLPPERIKIRGKNEAGQFIVFFDATYFAQGSNSIFVEGIDGDTSGCWDQVFIDGWKEYKNGGNDYRYFMLPPEKTMTLLCGLDDEFDMPVPYLTGVMTSLLDVLDAEQIAADKTALENYYLLVSKIPLLDNNSPDDYAVSWEIVDAVREMIEAALPSLAGHVVSPMEIEPVTFNHSNTTEQTDMVTKSINQVFALSGANQLVAGGGGSTSTVAIKQAIACDAALSFTWLSRLEANWQYYIASNYSNGDKYIFRFLEQTIYYQDDVINRYKDGVALGTSKLLYTAAQNMTPYEALCQLSFENAIGIADLFVPLQSSYNSSDRGRPTVSDDQISDSGTRTRDSGSNDNVKASK